MSSTVRVLAEKGVKLEFMKIDINSGLETFPPTLYPNIWTEIPPNRKVCIYTGLKHAKLYSMLGKGGIARPYVRVANLRKPGDRQAKTIFHVGDMFRFLDLLAVQQGSGEHRNELESSST